MKLCVIQVANKSDNIQVANKSDNIHAGHTNT